MLSLGYVYNRLYQLMYTMAVNQNVTFYDGHYEIKMKIIIGFRSNVLFLYEREFLKSFHY